MKEAAWPAREAMQRSLFAKQDSLRTLAALQAHPSKPRGAAEVAPAAAVLTVHMQVPARPSPPAVGIEGSWRGGSVLASANEHPSRSSFRSRWLK